ncbi:hypothetical protein H8D59_01590 [bacterium]|nr:hypothetical protein [bacterium]MBL7052566.1 hypothetical protein [Candidatus Neomarinimicrobiota bacterium]
MSKKIQIGGVIMRENLSLIKILGINNAPNSGGHIFRIFGDAGISMEFISTSETTTGKGSILICVEEKEHQKAKMLIPIIEREISPVKETIHNSVAMMTVYGPHFAEKPSIAAAFCVALGKAGINVLGVSTSINSVTCVIHQKKLNQAKIAIDKSFDYPK